MTQIEIKDILQSFDIIALKGKDNTIEFEVLNHSFGGSSSTITPELFVKSSLDDSDSDALFSVLGSVGGVSYNEVLFIVSETDMELLPNEAYYFKIVVGTITIEGNFYAVEKKTTTGILEAETLKVLYFGNDDIFDEFSRQTHYAAKLLKDKTTGVAQIDDVAISENDDEKTWYQDKLERVSGDVFQIISAYAHDVDNAYFWDAQIIGEEQEYVRYAVIFPTTWDDNLIRKLYKDIRDLLIANLKELWYNHSGMMEQSMNARQYYDTLWDSIMRTISSRKTKPTLTYRAF